MPTVANSLTVSQPTQFFLFGHKFFSYDAALGCTAMPSAKLSIRSHVGIQPESYTDCESWTLGTKTLTFLFYGRKLENSGIAMGPVGPPWPAKNLILIKTLIKNKNFPLLQKRGPTKHFYWRAHQSLITPLSCSKHLIFIF